MKPIVSFTTEPEFLIESEETISLYNFSLNEPPPDTGITVNINAPNLSEFDLSKAQIEGGKITLDEELEEQLQNALDGTRAAEIPGAAVAIVSPFGSWFAASGVSRLEDNTPLEPNDRFEIGSITKTFVATTVLQLVEEGKLSLQDTLTTLLPESITADIPNSEKITLKQLLQHTSGIADYVDVLFTQAAIDATVFLQEWEPEELVDLTDGVEPFFEPGESWRYSSTNFILAGLIIEAVTGNNIAAEIRTRILEPLNLENTFFAKEEEIPGGYISGYWDFDGNGSLDNISVANISWTWAAGAMVSNTQDLDTFARSLFKGDLLEPQTLEQMLDTIPTTDPVNYSSYGLGVGTIESPNRFWYIHRGQTLGYRSNMWYSPEDDLTYIELINGFSRDNLVRDILPPFREGIADENFNFTITEQSAQISLPVVNDGETEGEEIVTFTLETGEEYEVDANAQTGTFSIFDTSDEVNIIKPIVSFTSEPELLIESQETVSLLNFSLSETPPELGTTVTIKSSDLSEFNLNSIEIQGGEINLVGDDELNFTITEQNAQISLPVANDGETEGEEIATFTIEEGNRYEINPDAQTTTFSILDSLEQLILTPVADDNTTEIIDLSSFGNREITAEYTISREADFDNQVYFYAVDDINGNIDNLAPGADGYLQAALENIVHQEAFETSDDNTESGTIQMEAGSIIAPMIIVDGTLEQGKSGEVTVYLPYSGSNGSDRFDHIKMLNSNTFGFEDLPNGGDQDFNDIVIVFDKLSA